jgi:hypothetical protein
MGIGRPFDGGGGGGPDLSSYWFYGLEAAVRYHESSLD